MVLNQNDKGANTTLLNDVEIVMLRGDIKVPFDCCSFAIHNENNYNHQGKPRYPAFKEYRNGCDIFILNSNKIYEKFNLFIFDVDFPVFDNDDNFLEYLPINGIMQSIKALINMGVTYSVSQNGIKLYIRLPKEKSEDLITPYKLPFKVETINSDGEIKEKEAKIEILHLGNHHCDFAITNDASCGYYRIFNSNNFYKEYTDEQEAKIIDKFLERINDFKNQDSQAKKAGRKKQKHTYEGERLFTSFHNSILKKNRKYRNISTKEAIRLIVKQPDKFYQYLLEYDSGRFKIESGSASNAITSIQPFFFESYKDAFFAFVDYIEENIYPNIRNCDFTYLHLIPDKEEITPCKNEILEGNLNYNETLRLDFLGFEDGKFYSVVVFDIKKQEYFVENSLNFTIIKQRLKGMGFQIEVKKDDFMNSLKRVRNKDKLEKFYKDDDRDDIYYLNEYPFKIDDIDRAFQENPASFKNYTLNEDREEQKVLKLLIENLFLDNDLDENLIIQAGHFVYRFKPQFANVFCDKGGTGKDYYQILKSKIYGSDYAKESSYKNGFKRLDLCEKDLIYRDEFKVFDKDDFKREITSTELELNIKGKESIVADASRMMFEFSTNDINSIIKGSEGELSFSRRINYIYSENRKQLLDLLKRNGIDNPIHWLSTEKNQEALSIELKKFFYGIVASYGDKETFRERFNKAQERIMNTSKKKIEGSLETEDTGACVEIVNYFNDNKSKNTSKERVLEILYTYNLKATPFYEKLLNNNPQIYWKDLSIILKSIDANFLKGKGKDTYKKLSGDAKKKDGCRRLRNFYSQ